MAEIQAGEFGRMLKTKYGEYAPIVAMIAAQRHIVQWLIDNDHITHAGAKELTEFHFSQTMMAMQAIGKKAEDMPKLIRMANEAAGMMNAANAASRIITPDLEPKIIT